VARTISPGPRTPIRDQPGLISVPDLHSPYRALGKTPKWDTMAETRIKYEEI